MGKYGNRIQESEPKFLNYKDAYVDQVQALHLAY